MPFAFAPDWNAPGNNDSGASADDIMRFCQSAQRFGQGDASLLAALAQGSDQVKVLKGLHQETLSDAAHITVEYAGGVWHVQMPTTATGGRRVGRCTQWRG